MQFKRFSLLVVALLVAAFAIVAPTTPAQAASCSAGRLCLWDFVGYSGEEVAQTPPPPNTGICKNVPDWFNNRASALINSTGLGIVFFDEPQCRFQLGIVGPGSNGPIPYDNTISSWRTF